MTSKPTTPDGQANLRARAVSRLAGRSDTAGEHVSSSEALGVLYELASSPDTAADALALLHELQVHQVELDLQAEELRNSRGELEAALLRQVQVYDFLPAGCFTIDRDTVVGELNLTGARLLGFDRDQLIGRALDGFLTPDSGRALKAMLERVEASRVREARDLELATGDGVIRVVHAAASADPSARGFLLAFIDAGERGQARTRA